MSVFATTAAVVKTWANIETFPAPDDRLEVIWAANGGPFYPDACRDLIRRIYAAFPGASSLKTDLKYQQIKDTNSNSTGNIDTVDGLADAVAESLPRARWCFFRQPHEVL